MSEKRKIETEKLENEKKALEEKNDQNRRKIDALYQKQKQKREFNETINKKVSILMGSQETTRFFQNYQNQLTFIFDFMRTNVEIEKNLNFTTSHLQFKAYLYFFLYFELLDGVVDNVETQLIYRSVTKDLKLKERIPIGIIFNQI